MRRVALEREPFAQHRAQLIARHAGPSLNGSREPGTHAYRRCRNLGLGTVTGERTAPFAAVCVRIRRVKSATPHRKPVQHPREVDPFRAVPNAILMLQTEQLARRSSSRPPAASRAQYDPLSAQRGLHHPCNQRVSGAIGPRIGRIPAPNFVVFLLVKLLVVVHKTLKTAMDVLLRQVGRRPDHNTSCSRRNVTGDTLGLVDDTGPAARRYGRRTLCRAQSVSLLAHSILPCIARSPGVPGGTAPHRQDQRQICTPRHEDQDRRFSWRQPLPLRCLIAMVAAAMS